MPLSPLRESLPTRAPKRWTSPASPSSLNISDHTTLPPFLEWTKQRDRPEGYASSPAAPIPRSRSRPGSACAAHPVTKHRGLQATAVPQKKQAVPAICKTLVSPYPNPAFRSGLSRTSNTPSGGRNGTSHQRGVSDRSSIPPSSVSMRDPGQPGPFRATPCADRSVSNRSGSSRSTGE